MIQSGPTTGEFAALRKLIKGSCVEMLAAFASELGITTEQAQAAIIMTGLSALEEVRRQVRAKYGATKAAAIMFDACLTGYGWSGIAAYYDLQHDYIQTLDTLNGLTVRDDSNLPPTDEKDEEKG